MEKKVSKDNIPGMIDSAITRGNSLKDEDMASMTIKMAMMEQLRASGGGLT